MNVNSIAFISLNVIDIQLPPKRIKVFEYLKNYFTSYGFISARNRFFKKR